METQKLKTPSKPTQPADSNELITILKLTPSQRKTNQLAILESLCKHIKFFSELANEIGNSFYKDLCNKVTYEIIKSNSCVFEHGSIGTKFYVIIEGTVSVLVPIKKENIIDPVFIEVSKLTSGCAFGELALIKDQPRAATIRCLTDSHFAVLSKEDYLKIIGKNENKKLEELIKFLKGIPLFSVWSIKKLEKFSYFLKKTNFYRKQAVFSLGEPGNFVYIVKSGEFELTQPIKHCLTSPKKKDFLFKVALLAPGEVIGEKEVFFSQKYSVNCSCYSSQGELLIISKEHFLMSFGKDSCLSEFFDSQKDKYRIREDRLMSFEKSLKDVFAYRRIRKSKESSQGKLLRRTMRAASIEKSPMKMRPLSRYEIKCIEKRAIPGREKRVSTPLSIYSGNDIFLTYSPTTKGDKSTGEMISHRPGGYYRGKLKRPKTGCKSIDNTNL